MLRRPIAPREAWDPETLRVLERLYDELGLRERDDRLVPTLMKALEAMRPSRALGLHEEDAHYAALAADMHENPRDDRASCP